MNEKEGEVKVKGKGSLEQVLFICIVFPPQMYFLLLASFFYIYASALLPALISDRCYRCVY